MIETYFQPGALFNWNKEGDDQSGNPDGSIVTQTPIHGSMTYNGQDPYIFDKKVNVTTVGLRIGLVVNYIWLNYKPGHTTKLPLSGDTLTGYMSGCWLVTWSEGGQRFVGHIGSIDSNPGVNAAVKSTFRAIMPRDAQGFRPAEAWSDAEMSALHTRRQNKGQPWVLGLITATGQFYSILVFQKILEYCIAGIKEVQPTSGPSLRLALGGTLFER